MVAGTLALDRALTNLARDAHGHRDALIAALCEEAADGGMFPRYRGLRTVADVRRLGLRGLIALPTMREARADAAAWLLRALDAAPERAAVAAGPPADTPPSGAPLRPSGSVLETMLKAASGRPPPVAPATPRLHERRRHKRP